MQTHFNKQLKCFLWKRGTWQFINNKSGFMAEFFL